jgi:phenylalanyl-tRNA synthetase beta chain
MNVSLRWLKAIAPTIQASAEELAHQITHSAVPVEEVRWLGHGLEELVVGRVLKVSEHPRADRLVICEVDIGSAEPVQVVTGAPRVREGAFYPFVGAGQTLPGGQLIQRVKLRGESSEGMLCSERELGIGRDAAGIMEMIGEFEPGQPLLAALHLDDYRLELEITPNRPDLLGHWGVAREAAPGGESDLRLPEFPGARGPELNIASAEREGRAGGVTVRIEDAEGCPRYMGAVIRGVTIGPAPEWLAGRLRAIGLQPINNVVDATNYVLYELNQPLHAFDIEKLAGPALVIRRAREREVLRTLDGKDRTLGPEMLVIADAERPCALAGLMGGEVSEVSTVTRDIFLECAYFDPRRVRHAVRGLGLDTDAAYRFQRGIDPAGLTRALQRVVDLILATAGGEMDGTAIDVGPGLPPPGAVRLRSDRVSRTLGIELDRATITGCLEPLGFEVGPGEGEEEAMSVSIPTWRPDVEREIDLIEEVARRYGYEKFADELRPFRPTRLLEEPYRLVAAETRELMVGRGFLEALTLPFVSAEEGEVRLLNPLSEREDHLRRGLLSGLIHRLEHNFARGLRDIRLFEIGTVFAASGGTLPTESIRLGAAWTGRRRPPHWSASGEDDDWNIWDAKSIFESVAAVAAPGTEVRPLEEGDGAGAPPDLERAFVAMTADGRMVGWAGRVPPARIDAPRWAGAVWGLEVEMVPGRREVVAYKPLPIYPATERDIALIVPRGAVAAEVEATIREVGPETLESLSIFDVYEGENIPDGTRSIAWRLRFRSADRTLTDEEVEAAMERIMSSLRERHDVALRGA